MKKKGLLIRIPALIFMISGIVFLVFQMIGRGSNNEYLNYALLFINLGNLFNILATRYERKGQTQSTADKVLSYCAIVLFLALMVMFIVLVA